MTENQRSLLNICLKGIEEKLGWGDSNEWTNSDFLTLSNRILEETNVMLSASTLKRVWGRVKHEGKPATSTLDALAIFIGYENWRSFAIQGREKLEETNITIEEPRKSRASMQWLYMGLTILFIGLGYFLWGKRESGVLARNIKIKSGDYAFNSEPLVRNIPNTVIFTYDATDAPMDSVFIQQSWDPKRREQVPRDSHKYTSIYYEPGFYTAKLIVGQQVVKGHPLLISSDGWLAAVTSRSMPFYFDKKEFLHQDGLFLPPANISSSGIDLMPDVPLVKYYNVGNFDPIPLHGFSFSAEVKNEYMAANNACQFSNVVLITDSLPIVLPLSTRGCVSKLNLMGGEQTISGKNTDLSGFGVDFSDWVKVGCRNDGKKLLYHVNDALIYELPLLSDNRKILGIVFTFTGTGSIKSIKLNGNNGKNYHEF